MHTWLSRIFTKSPNTGGTDLEAVEMALRLAFSRWEHLPWAPCCGTPSRTRIIASWPALAAGRPTTSLACQDSGYGAGHGETASCLLSVRRLWRGALPVVMRSQLE